jgi:hypothetical protein
MKLDIRDFSRLDHAVPSILKDNVGSQAHRLMPVILATWEITAPGQPGQILHKNLSPK